MNKIKRTFGAGAITFKCNARTPFFYKSEFGTDFFADMIALGSAFDGGNIDPVKVKKADFTVLTQIAWACNKTANRDCPDFEEWLDKYEDFDTFSDGTEIMNMVMSQMNTKKK